MSVRRRNVAARVERDSELMRQSAAASAAFGRLCLAIDQAISERDGQRRMDDDGAPPIDEVPRDAYAYMVAETVRLSL